jgi:hypothetical protein
MANDVDEVPQSALLSLLRSESEAQSRLMLKGLARDGRGTRRDDS